MDSKNILIVDDDFQMCKALSESLRRTPYSFDTAIDGTEALSMLERTNYSLVISDLRMPKIDGLELLRKARNISENTLFIMITAHGTIDTAVLAMKDGAFDFITKPFSHKILLISIDRAFKYLGERKKSIKNCKDTNVPSFIGEDPKIKNILSFAKDVAPSKSTILLSGESGTGKEILARFIHEWSGRKNKAFVAVNCAAIPENLLESELFGHEKGAFTGAVNGKTGKFELANHGTLLLDEIGEMNVMLQAKLLRVIQEHEIDRVGAERPLPVDVRLIATTNRDLRKEIREGRFREDLYYRLNVIPIKFPTLKERSSDVALLAAHFLRKYNMENDKNVEGISQEGLRMLHKYHWPGNVRELENIIERAVVLCKEKYLQASHLFLHGMFGDFQEAEREEMGESFVGKSLPEVEKQVILKTLEKLKGNRTHAARVLGISIRTLRNKLHEYNLLGAT